MAGLLAGWIVMLISAAGYGGVLLLMAIESACIPIPSELIMPFAGFLVSTGRFGLLPVALAGALGCNLGSWLAYWIGAKGGRAVVMQYGRYVLVSTRELDQAERFFARFGAIAVLIGRLLPVVRTFIALPAGMARMRQAPFHLFTFAGSFVWCLALAYAGDQLGVRWNRSPLLQAVMHRMDAAVVMVLALGLLWFVVTHLRRIGISANPP